MTLTAGHDLVVVANRLPVQAPGPSGPWGTSPGGLVRALGSSLPPGTAWVGWAGFVDVAPAPFQHAGLHLVPVPLSPAEHERCYEGFANATLWPLFHSALRPPEIEPTWWDAYVTVNQRFADAVADVAAPDAVVWVHDYHLMLLPAMLRRQRPDVRVGFFLHIPFPPTELLQRLPWREDLLRGLLAADVVGLQRQADVENLTRASLRLLDDAVDESPWLMLGEHAVHLDAHPISIDSVEFEELARRPDIIGRARELRAQLGDPTTLLVGVDRLDYTKGIDARLRTFGALLDEGRLDPATCTLVQVAVPTRGGVEAYANERQAVERLVGELNGRHSRIGAPVVTYLHRSLPVEELVALYLAADVLLVTPFHDGMNLVAKEFVASRVDGRGVLVLSEFAGAADELHDALVVNPFDEQAVADAVVRAAWMPEAEVRARMVRLRTVVAGRSVGRWANRFLGLLDGKALARAS
jgi:alpha,alpha-trehalose-phosphate synthase [UDP-forming]